MISDSQLEFLASGNVDARATPIVALNRTITDLAAELLKYREAERKAQDSLKAEDSPEDCCLGHVWIRDESFAPHPYVCKICGENMDESCFGDDL